MTQETHSEPSPPKALLKSARWRPSMVWGVPIMALLLGAMLILQTYRDQGPTIEIEFPFAAGLKADATPIKFLDVEVGHLTEVRLNDTLDGVVVVAEIDPDAETFLREGTVFWLVRPQFSMAGISAIETLLSGQYIEVVPSQTGERVTKFDGRLSPPVGVRYPSGKSIILETAQLGSIAQGTPVFHRNLRAGEVEHYELGERGEPIRIYIVIDEDFAPRVREGSLFWNASGIEAHIGLDGVDIRTEGITAVLSGGIAFSTPEGSSPESETGTSFPLHAGVDAAQKAQLRSESLELRIESRDGKDLADGTPIYYRNIQIGHIGESWITPDAQAVRAEVFIKPRFSPLMKEGTRFYKTSGIDVSLGLDGLEVRSGPLRSIVSGGISIATPESSEMTAASLHLFALHEEPEIAWLAWRPSIELANVRHGEADGHRLPPRPDAGTLDLILRAKEIGSVTLNSLVTYRRYPVGRVIDHDLARDGESVEVRIRIDAKYRHLIGSSTRFWRPAGFSVEAGLSGLEFEFYSLRTLATGAIAFDNPLGRGDAATSLARFALHADEAIALQDLRESRHRTVVVEAPESSLTAGAPVYYRKYEIGKVGRSALTADARGVRVELHIDLEYAPLVRTNTRFWSPSALSFRGDLGGVELDVAPLQAMLVGGVMLATPTESGEEAPEASVYRLEAAAPAGSEKWRPRLLLSEGVLTAFDDFADQPRALRILIEATNVDAIHDGDPIFYRGLQVGAVSTRTLAPDGTYVVLAAAIEAQYASLIRGNTQFWNASGIEIDLSLSGIKVETGPLETFVQGGIELATPDSPSAPAAEGDRFVLREAPDEDWREWSPVLR